MPQMNECVFCRIAAGQAPAEVLLRDEWVTAFRDVHPVAPTHVLIIPNQHLESLSELGSEHLRLGGRLLEAAAQVARAEKVEASGYRVILNTGRDSGQIVPHLHLHVIGGRAMRFPIG